MSHQCKICGHGASPFAKAMLLNKYQVEYFRCLSCGYICTEEPHWLEEAYDSAIAAADLGLVSRNVHMAQVTSRLARFLFEPSGQFIDFGAGYGMFVRLMRDNGYDFRHFDKYCTNLFAKGFEVPPQSDVRFELLTAFELFEHLVDPREGLEEMLQFSRNIFFSTILLPSPTPLPNQWWYYMLESGQHVSLYSEQSLQALADEYNLHFVSDGRSLHLMTERPISKQWARALMRGKWTRILTKLCRRKSLLADDVKSTCAIKIAG